MPATLRQAHDQILGLLHAAALGIVVQYPDMPSPASRPPQGSWARVMVEDSDDAGSNTLVGSRGNRRYETNGILTVEIYALSGDGRREAQRLAEVVLRAYRGRKTTGGVWFRRERVRDVGPDGTWYHVNVIVEYQYDTIEVGTERGIGGAVALAPVEASADVGAVVSITGGTALGAVEATGGADVVFSPASVVSAWLRNDTLSGGVASEPDVLNTNPAVQASAGLQLTGEAAGSMVSDGSVVMTWPMAASNNSQNQWGFARWVEFASVASVQWLYSVSTSGSNLNRLRFGITATGAVQAVIFVSNTDGYVAASAAGAVSAGAPVFFRLAYDVGGATDADKIKILLGEVEQTLTLTPFGSGGTLGQLRDATGSANLGAVNTSGSQCLGSGSRLGRNGYVMSDNLTTQEGANLMNFEALT